MSERELLAHYHDCVPGAHVWRPVSVEEPEDGLQDRGRQEQLDERPALHNGAGEDADQNEGATRITLRPHDPATGEEIDKAEVVKGYEYDRGHFVTFTAEELKALDLESSKIIDLEKFAPGRSIDPVYLTARTTSIPTRRSRSRRSG